MCVKMNRMAKQGWVRPCAVLAAGLLLLAGPLAGRADDMKDAIVKIYTIVNTPDYYNPWSMRGTGSGTGSGAILKGRKILTNAHVVGNQTFIQVRRYGEAQRYTARVLNVSHESDLALLTVDDPKFFERGSTLELGELPEPQDEVLVYGFPLGGDTLSITKGVISRIEHQTYSHSSAHLLAGQIDAAINPGNSGGPVLREGKIVGVVMQGMTQADNIGYMVPANVVQHFFRDIEDGRHDGFPSLGVVLQEMENPDLKRKYGQPVEQTGMLVTRVLPGSPADGELQPGDVLLSLDGHPVADDGTVEFRPRQRTSLAYWVQERQVGESLPLEMLRAGKNMTLNLTLDRPAQLDPLVPTEQYDVLPTYYIYGGVVFCPLTKNLLRAWGPNWYANAPNELVARLADNVPEVEGEQVVLALKVLADDVNQGYHGINNWVVETVDGQRVRNLKQLIAAVEQGQGNEFVTFGDDAGQVLVLDRAKVEAQRTEVLNTYRIPADRSPDVQ
jgi:S1-C subfamily serine protease